MRYVLAILFPPLAVLMCGKLFQTVLNVFLTMLFWIPGMIHAFMVVSAWERRERLVELATIAGGARPR